MGQMMSKLCHLGAGVRGGIVGYPDHSLKSLGMFYKNKLAAIPGDFSVSVTAAAGRVGKTKMTPDDAPWVSD